MSVQIKKGSKVAIVGRSGSGKSSFIHALYKLVKTDPGSSYKILNKDAYTIPLSELRGYFSCIPQHPYIFNQSIRKNVDPFDRFQDDEVK